MTSRRRARLKFKQQPMTPSSSPVREVSDQQDCPGSTTTTGHHHPQQPERDDEPQRADCPADEPSIHGQAIDAVAELDGLSLKIDTFPGANGEVVKAVSDEEKDTDQAASPLDDQEEGSQTSSEESWASFPSNGSRSTDSNSSADEEEATGAQAADDPLPSPETTFKFHEEFSNSHVNDNYGLEPLPPPPRGEDEEEEFAMGEEDEEEDEPCSPPGPWSSVAVPRWAFLRSSNSLPVLGLGPEDFYHGGSALRHEVSAYEDEDEDKEVEGSDEDVESRGSHDIATVGVVHL